MGSSSLYQSVLNQSYRDIKFWLEVQKVDINTLTETRDTAMHAAAQLDNPEFAQYIHECGASLDIINDAGHTPLFISLAKKCKKTAVFLINAGSPVNTSLTSGTSPLILACELDDVEICSLLIGNGADVNKFNYAGVPLHYSVNSGSLKIVSLLIKNGAKLDEQCRIFRLTPLGLAILDGNYKITRFLIDQGANLEIVSRGGWRPLHIATSRGDIELITLLLNRGANINSKNSLGNTSLHIAAKDNNKECFELLVEKGAITTIHNHYGMIASLDPEANDSRYLDFFV